MDYEDGTVFDYDPSVCHITAHPLLSIKCHTTTAGRGTTIGLNQSHCKAKTLGASGSSDSQNKNYLDEMYLSKQIQQASGTSYSNELIESNFSDSLTVRKSRNQFKDRNEATVSTDSNPFGVVTMPQTLNTIQNFCKMSKPSERSNRGKQKGKKTEFHRLQLNSSRAEKSLSDVFKTQQSFNPAGWKSEDRYQLGSKCDFPVL